MSVCLCQFLYDIHNYWCIGGFLNHIRIIVNNPYTRVIVSDCRIDLCCSTVQTEKKGNRAENDNEMNERDRV